MRSKPKLDSGSWVPSKSSLRQAGCMLLALVSVSPAQAAAPAPRVEIHVDGSVAAVVRTRDTAEELFARLGAEVRVVGPDDGELAVVPPTPPTAIVHIDLSSELRPKLVILDGLSGREIDRREFSETSSLETSVEAVTHVCYLVLEPRLHPAPLPPAPPATAAASPAMAARDTAKPAPESPGMPVAFGVGAAFSAVSLGSGGVLPGGGVSADARFGPTRDRFGALFVGTLYGSSALEMGAAQAGLRPLRLRLLLTRDFSLRGKLSLLLGTGAGLDRFSIEPETVAGDVQVTETRSVWSPVLSELGGVRLGLGQRVHVTAAAGLDIDLAPKTFTATVGDDERVLLALPRLRPSLLIGASFGLNEGSSAQTVASP